MDTDLLPPDTDRLSAACAASGWVLALEEDRVHTWSAGSGWTRLTTPRGRDLTILGAVDAGILVFAEPGPGSPHSGELGLWPFGGREWAFWSPVPHCPQLLDGILLLERESGDIFLSSNPSVVRIRAVGPRGLEVRQETEVTAATDCEHLLGACRLSDGSIRLATSSRLLTMDASQPRELGRMDEGLGFSLVGTSLAMGSTLLAWRSFTRAPLALDLARGTACVARFPFPTFALRHFWQAYLRDDRDFVRRALAALGSLPETDGSSEVHDLLVADGGVTAVVGPGGVCPVGSRPRRQLRGVEAASWRLWVDPVTHLEEAVEELLDGPMMAEEALVEGLAQEAGERLPALVLESARRRRRPPTPSSTRAVFARCGGSTSDFLLEALADDHPWVSLAALQGLATASVARPLLKGARRPLLESRFQRVLESDEPEHRVEVLHALVQLDWHGFPREVAVALRDEDERVREAAAAGSRELGRRRPEIRAALCRAAGQDVEAKVRRGAVEALAAIGTADAHARIAAACSDSDPSVRFSALSAVADRAAHLDLSTLWDVVDRTLLLLIAAQEARRNGADRTDFGSGVDPVHTALAKGLARRILAIDDLSDLSAAPAGRRARLAPSFVFGVLLGRLFPEVDDVGRGPEAVRRVVDQAGVLSQPPILSQEEVESLLTHRPPSLVAVLAERFRGRDPRASLRLEVLAVLASRSVGGSCADAEGGATLSRRLRALSAPSPFRRCVDRVRALSAEPSILGLVAAYALAARGDDAASQRFVARSLGLDLEDCPALATFCAVHLGPALSVAFAGRLATRSALPPQLRLRALEELPWLWPGGHEFVPADALDELHATCVGSAATPFGTRLRLARELLDRGVPAPLEALWLDREAAGRVRAAEAYECDRDLALCGHAERMPRVRAEWRSRGDGLALRTFELHGESGDIPSLEAAAAEGWIPEFLQHAIEAIRVRHAAGDVSPGA